MDITEVIAVTPHCPTGTTYLGLAKGALSQGLIPYLVRVGINEIGELLMLSQLPVIVAVDNSHFISVIRVNKDEFEIFDPNKGRMLMAREKFSEQWDGRVLAFGKRVNATRNCPGVNNAYCN